jgi:hypothetical protein
MSQSLGSPASSEPSVAPQSAGTSVAPQSAAPQTGSPVVAGASNPIIQAASFSPMTGTPTAQGAGFKQDTPPPPPAPQTGAPIKVPQRPYPPTVINTNATPPLAEASGTGSVIGGTAPPKCDAGDLIQHGLEVAGGGVAVGVAVPAEVPSVGSSTAIVIGGAASVTAGVNGFKDCAE